MTYPTQADAVMALNAQAMAQKSFETVVNTDLVVGMESINFASVSGVFKALATQVTSTLKAMVGFTDMPVIDELPKDQRKFLALIKAIPYTSLGEIQAQTVEGSSCTYLEYLATLKQATQYAVGVPEKVSKYLIFLGQFVSDQRFSTSTYDDKKLLEGQEKIRHHHYDSFGKLHKKNSVKALTRVRDVVERNGDWEKVFKEINPIISSLEGVDRKKIQAQIKQCNDYLEIIIQEFSKNKDRKVSQEAANRLSNLAYDIGRDLEFYATTHFRLLQIRGGIEVTMNRISESLE
jgi:hypothetical protein